MFRYTSITLMIGFLTMVSHLNASDNDIIKEWHGNAQYKAFPQRQNMQIKDQKSWHKLWQQLGRKDSPKIDFTTQMAIAVFMGDKRSGGYSVKINRIKETAKTLELDIAQQSPNPGGPVTTVMTSPYHIVVIKKSDKQIQFTQ